MSWTICSAIRWSRSISTPASAEWHYQFTPNDGHDWDSAQDVVLVDRMWRGEMRKLLLHADRNGHFYVLDRTNGKFLVGHAVRLSELESRLRCERAAAAGARIQLQPRRQLLRLSDAWRRHQFPGAVVQPADRMVLSGVLRERAAVHQHLGDLRSRASVHRAGDDGDDAGEAKPNEPAASAGIKALDPETGDTKWDFKIYQGSSTNGVLATAGNVVFAAIRDGNIAALDARTGRHLWHFQTARRWRRRL